MRAIRAMTYVILSIRTSRYLYSNVHVNTRVQLDCDVEWKFARTKLWLNYMDNDTALPIPFNLLPTWGSARNACRFLCKWLSHEHGLLFDRPRSYTFIKASLCLCLCLCISLSPIRTPHTLCSGLLLRLRLWDTRRASSDYRGIAHGLLAYGFFWYTLHAYE